MVTTVGHFYSIMGIPGIPLHDEIHSDTVASNSVFSEPQIRNRSHIFYFFLSTKLSNLPVIYICCWFWTK